MQSIRPQTDYDRALSALLQEARPISNEEIEELAATYGVDISFSKTLK